MKNFIKKHWRTEPQTREHEKLKRECENGEGGWWGWSTEKFLCFFLLLYCSNERSIAFDAMLKWLYETFSVFILTLLCVNDMKEWMEVVWGFKEQILLQFWIWSSEN